MKKRVRVTIFAVCALLMCLMVTSALADYKESKATINNGSTFVQGAVNPNLSTNTKLYGYVVSYDATTGGKLIGSMWTGNIYGPYIRGSASVAKGEISPSYSWQPNGTGYFFAIAEAPDSNHDGRSLAYQLS